MYVKGVAFLARQSTMVSEHGEQRWNEYLTAYAERVPFFRNPILPVTLIPTELFLGLNDDIVRTFYGGDARVFWRFGVASGHHALTAGHLRGVFAPGEYQRFGLFTPRIWKAYYDTGGLETRQGDGWVEIAVRDIPFPHRYYEETVMGFVVGGLQVLGMREPAFDVVRSALRGDPDVLYRFHLHGSRLPS